MPACSVCAPGVTKKCRVCLIGKKVDYKTRRLPDVSVKVWHRSTARCQGPIYAPAVSWTSLLRDTWLPASAVHSCTPPHIMFTLLYLAPHDACFQILFSVQQKYSTQTSDGNKSEGIFNLVPSFIA